MVIVKSRDLVNFFDFSPFAKLSFLDLTDFFDFAVVDKFLSTPTLLVLLVYHFLTYLLLLILMLRNQSLLFGVIQ